MSPSCVWQKGVVNLHTTGTPLLFMDDGDSVNLRCKTLEYSDTYPFRFLHVWAVLAESEQGKSEEWARDCSRETWDAVIRAHATHI